MLALCLALFWMCLGLGQFIGPRALVFVEPLMLAGKLGVAFHFLGMLLCLRQGAYRAVMAGALVFQSLLVANHFGEWCYTLDATGLFAPEETPSPNRGG